MEQEKLTEFNQELKALLEKYNVALTIEDVPASKRIVVAPIAEKTTGTNEPTK